MMQKNGKEIDKLNIRHMKIAYALLDGGETLENLQSARQAIKDKYPKQ